MVSWIVTVHKSLLGVVSTTLACMASPAATGALVMVIDEPGSNSTHAESVVVPELVSCSVPVWMSVDAPTPSMPIQVDEN